MEIQVCVCVCSFFSCGELEDVVGPSFELEGGGGFRRRIQVEKRKQNK